jgi:hypothetical protein
MDHKRWQAWFEGESKYQDAKFDASRSVHDQLMRSEGVRIGGRWEGDINMYIHRANMLGLNKPNGRQALAKAAMVVIAAVESAERVFGPLPEPGHTSGEIAEWDYVAE